MELDPSKTAVVAVHMQGDIVGPEGAFAGFFHGQIVEKDIYNQVARLLDAARASGATAAYTRVAWSPDYSDLNPNSPLLGMVAQTGCLKDGAPLADIVDAVKPAAGDLIVTHKRVGGFQDSSLDAELKARGIDTLVFCGVATNASVEGTARAAGDLGYRTVVVTDACSAAAPEVHEASIGSLGLLAEISTVDEVVSALSA